MIVNEYVLININASIIYENERNLESLYDILMRLRTEVNTPTLQNTVKDLINSVAEELQEDEIKFRVKKRNKCSLLPFVGTALKSLFGISTEEDSGQAKEHLNKVPPTIECEQHLNLHEERMLALLQALKGHLAPALILPRGLKSIINWTMSKHFH